MCNELLFQATSVSLSIVSWCEYRLDLIINFLMIQVRLAIRVCRIAGESKQTSPRIYIYDTFKENDEAMYQGFPESSRYLVHFVYLIDLIIILFYCYYNYYINFTCRLWQRFHFRRENYSLRTTFKVVAENYCNQSFVYFSFDIRTCL